MCNTGKRTIGYLVEADIKGFFDNADHGWMMKFLEHDIADKKFLELIEKFLHAGIMENGKYLDSERGTPQGNGASPVLANVYLHYVLDNWFDVIVKRQCEGQSFLIRYCDDFVCCFQNKWEAEVFYQRLQERLDEVDYSEKLTAILANNNIKSITILRMEVPCCGGIVHAAKTAFLQSGKMVPWRVVTISTDGKVLED